ncbi:cutinase family protein [Nocardia sp. NPDC050406]|uniref:cutinase family protein n=1 Tax=Nocardia sp. NPDC050406 TaxID=3364318 RepID=UPI0037A52CCB
MSVRMHGGVLTAAVAISAGVLCGAAPAQADPAWCPDLYVVAAPGTWETSLDDPRQGMLSMVTDGLPSNVRSDYVNYPATALPWEGEVYGRSKMEAFTRARGLVSSMAQQCGTTRFALLGYSQGADAVGDLAAEIGTGLGVVPADRVAAVGLIADPRRSPLDPLVGPPVPGAGAGGPRPTGFGWLSPRVRTFCAVGDLYCSTTTTDFATRIAGFFAQISAPDPAHMGRYQSEFQSILDDLMISGGWPTLQLHLSDPNNEARFREFFESAVHQSYPHYVVDDAGVTTMDWLRRWLTEAAR